jgi:hypothetical protein
MASPCPFALEHGAEFRRQVPIGYGKIYGAEPAATTSPSAAHPRSKKNLDNPFAWL